MKVRISKNLKGKIVIPTLSTRSIDANTTFTITDAQYWNADIQQAIVKRLLVVEGVQPKSTSEVKKIVNKSKQAVVLPGVGVLKPNRAAVVKADDLDTEDFKRLLDAGILREEGKAAPAKAQRPTKEKVDESPTNDWKAVIIDPTADGESRARQAEPRTRMGKKPTEKNKTGTVRAGEDSIIIDPRAKSVSDDDNDEDSDIIFVDREQQKERVKEHPVLGKTTKKGKKSS